VIAQGDAISCLPHVFHLSVGFVEGPDRRDDAICTCDGLLDRQLRGEPLPRGRFR
jgi:hypothetical protein